MPIAKRSYPSEDIIPNVVKVLDLILMGIKSKGKHSKPYHDNYTKIAIEACQPQCAKTIAKQCVGLLNKCLSSHRYKEAAKLLWVLCQDRSVFDMFIFRSSMIVFENLEIENRDEIMWTFFSEIQNLEVVNKKEVQLEYVIHGLTHRCSDVIERTQALINMKRKNYLRKNPRLDPIFEAYLAYLECVELCGYLSDDTTDAEQFKIPVNEVILKLNSLIDNPGDWDIFVLKYVELLEKYAKKDDREKEVEDVLLRYAKNNPDSLNAHIYLSVYLNKIDPTSEVLIQQLEKISEMSPSDERVLILLEKLKQLDKKLNKCFMFLDYPSNGKNNTAWQMLLDFLYQAKQSKNTKALRTIDTCWKSRQKSWHWTHFNPTKVPSLNETELLAAKVKVLLFLDKDHAYIKEVFEKFPTLRESLNEKKHFINEHDRSESMEF